ncbi:efflux RND transporter periplasmic adaptor subunit [Litoreibacter roseus]|uniref:Hemolysin secretion protein D n=1 Tax=Litoreibacter roseus TaxID=2601869 RepID=A0A6N6JIU8_9RHOB|nr:efflux RND transporter periplasmic adaptor subunit [Litoreibacter roseus]GFE66196.1 hemolysin secretion protein D [Litoreibacter roseus]
MIRPLAALSAVLLLMACLPGNEDETTQSDDPVRAVKTVVAQHSSSTQLRTFPAILEPPQITQLAFEVGGRLGAVDLQIGQNVAKGDVLLTINPEDFDLQKQQAEAALAEAESGLQNARDEADRQIQLFERNVASRVARDRAVTARDQALARVEQLRRTLDLVRGSNADTQLLAPFDSIVNSIEVQNFGAVQPGQPVVTLYQDNGLQARILVSYHVVSQLSLGDAVVIRSADQPDVSLPARISEIARRAPAVSAFPVIVKLEETPENLRSGMAVETVIELPIEQDTQGILLPVSALATHLTVDLARVRADGQKRSGQVFVVKDGVLAKRDVVIAGIDGTEMIVSGGLKPGDRVVTAGVPFLYPDQRVSLWNETAEVTQ